MFFFVSIPLDSIHAHYVEIMSSNDDDIAQRTLAAKREAEKLKEKIKRKKESLADTTCKLEKERELSIFIL